jgi:DNA-directed RNA polymerase specialized sigma24 family protein
VNETRDADFDFEALKKLHEIERKQLERRFVVTLRICWRYFRDGWTASQIAAECGCSEGAVRQTIHRARLQLKR